MVEIRIMQYQFQLEQGVCVLSIRGSLNVYEVGRLWKQLERELERFGAKSLLLDLSKLDYMDGGGVSFLHFCERRMKEAQGSFSVRGLKPAHKRLMELYGPASASAKRREEYIFSNIPDRIGRLTYGFLESLWLQIAFIGEIVWEMMQLLKNPRRLRFQDMLHTMDAVGVRGVGIVSLIGFLLGLILAFQSAIPMRQFGVEIFVANLVGLSLIRELGPLITCVILAGRSGSSFAAEIGTMKINEELSALKTMGLSPVRFLVVPKMIGMLLVTPFLTIFFNFMGILGGSVVLLSMGYPMVAYLNQVSSSVDLSDAAGGLFKAVVFAILVAGVGSYQGIFTGTGAQAVGTSATRAVVHGIILIAVTDGAFAVLFFVLGI